MTTYRIWTGYEMIYQDTPTVENPCMLSTGQQDSQGKEVFECDILQRGRARGVVEYDDYTMRFSVRFGAELVGLNEASAFTVIGNAFEQPQLI